MDKGDLNPATKAASRMWAHSGHQSFSFGLIANEEVARVKAATGFDLSGYSRFMATRGVRHIRQKHSNSLVEAQRQQLAVKPLDFALIPEIGRRGEVRLIGQIDSRKPIRLEHCATFEDRIYVMIETVGQSEKRLELSNMWIKQMKQRKI